MSDKVTVIFSGNVNPAGKEFLGAYLAKAQPMTAAAGGITTATYNLVGPIAGENVPQMLVIVEFPDAASVHALYDSEQYKALISDRDKGLTNLNVYACKLKV